MRGIICEDARAASLFGLEVRRLPGSVLVAVFDDEDRRKRRSTSAATTQPDWPLSALRQHDEH